MKKIYETPAVLVEQLSAIHFIAASKLDNTLDAQDITLTETEFDSEFYVKEDHTQSWEDSLW